MSNYGPPPGNPQNHTYGVPPAPGYGGGPLQPGYGGAHTYASWGHRFVAYLVDAIATAAAGILYWVGYGLIIASGISTDRYDAEAGGYVEPNTALGAVGTVLALIGCLMMIAFVVWNYGAKQGKTGATIGKGVMGIKVVKEADGQVLGFWFSIGRQFVHIIDTMACYIGWLWPLWDSKRQTFADKIVSTVVVSAPK